MLHNDLCVAQEALMERLYADDSISTEGFLLRAGEAIFRIFHNIKATVLHLQAGLKRSELRAYQEGHIFSVRKVLHAHYLPLSSTKIHLPDGMSEKYPVTALSLHGLAKYVDISAAVSHAEHALRLVSDNRDAATIAGELDKLAGAINKLGGDGEIERVLQHLFTNARRGEAVLASTQFSSVGEFVTTFQHILEYEPFYKKTLDDSKKIHTFDQSVDVVITRMEHTPPSREIIKGIYDVVLALSKMTHRAASLTHEMMRVEHNFTMALHAFAKDLT